MTSYQQYILARIACYVLDGNGQFHGNFLTITAAQEWIKEHENAEFGLRIVKGVFTR